jgi:GDP-L-fucose synthase
MPSNLYGPGDNFHLENAHVVPALLRRFHNAKISGAQEVVVWGTGSPAREFLHVDDLASAAVHLMNVAKEQLVLHISSPTLSHINAGTGEDCTILDLTKIIANIVGFSGRITFDTTKPDGTMRKLLDVARIHKLGWRHSIPLEIGLRQTYAWFLQNQAEIRST